MDEHALADAVKQMRLLLMATGSMTLEQVDREAPGLTRAIVGTYLDAIRPDFPGMG